MNKKTILTLATVGFVTLGVILMSWFLFVNPVADLVENIPGMDNRPAFLSGGGETVEIGAIFAAFDGTPSLFGGSWPRFRGEDFTNIITDNIALADSWGDTTPPLLWSVDLGEGHSGPAIAEGRVYVMDYDEQQRADMLRCFSLDDGKEIWRRGYNVYIKRNHGMSRTVPAVSGGYVVTIGPKCHVMCVDADTGDFRWGIDLVKEYGAEVPLWYTGQCPLIDGPLAIIAVGGSALMIAVECETGRVVWETPNPHDWKMSHSSIVPYTIHGREMYVYCALGGITGVSSRGEDAGIALLETDLWNNNVIVPSPLYIGDGRLFVTAGYGAGSMMLDIIEENGSLRAEMVQRVAPDEGIASEQQTMIYYDDHLYSVLPKDAGPNRNEFVCCDPDDIGRFVWTSGTMSRFGLGPYIVADGKFYILSDDGVLTVMRADTTGPVILGQAKILDGHDAWGPMALVNGRLLARDSRRMVCVDLRAAAR